MITRTEVNVPIYMAFGLFLDKKEFPRWKMGYKRYEAVTGEPGQTGTVTRLHYDKFMMTETILEKEAPGLYVTRYEFIKKGKTIMVHKAVNTFMQVGKDKTEVSVESTIEEVYDPMMKLILRLFPKAGKRQFQQQLKLFKTLAEERYTP